jgi:hypothetical protein
MRGLWSWVGVAIVGKGRKPGGTGWAVRDNISSTTGEDGEGSGDRPRAGGNNKWWIEVTVVERTLREARMAGERDLSARRRGRLKNAEVIRSERGIRGERREGAGSHPIVSVIRQRRVEVMWTR